MTVKDEADADAVYGIVSDHEGVVESTHAGSEMSARFEPAAAAVDFAGLVEKLEKDPRVDTVPVGILSGPAP